MLKEITEAINRIYKRIKELLKEAKENYNQYLLDCSNIARKLNQEENELIIKRVRPEGRRNEAFK